MLVRRYRSTGLLVVLLIAGALIGGALEPLFATYLPFLSLGETVGFTPTTLNLSVLKLTVGLSLRINVAGVIGILLGYLLYRQL
ncbi:MAG: hypothetical protein PWP12_463 [Bacillota bacterium]|jgi:hypothetical protein|nr:hypothetical protein [Bacillota bacterium]MDK2881809.1 hypothetical protein [Bacillota bacterium]MDK2960279.1 hypothetical protein [Bacillota bacterium]